MPLVKMTDVLAEAARGGYAVVAFNAFHLDAAQAVVETAEETGSPVIVQCSPVEAVGYHGTEVYAAAATVLARNARVPVALHLDHTTEFAHVIAALRHGFTSVMVDYSAMPFEENVARTCEVVRVAHALGVPVEAELGRVPRPGDEGTIGSGALALTEPEDAARFVEMTAVDALAVAVGTAHGLYAVAPKVDVDRVGRIARLVRVPLVLHGGTGTPPETVRAAIAAGIRKFNVGTALYVGYVREAERILATTPVGKVNAKQMARDIMAATRAVVREHLALSGSLGKAR